MNFKNKTVAVTGAVGSIGSAIVRCFASFGANVAICDLRNTEGLAEELKKEGCNAAAFNFDITSREDVEKGFAEIAKTFGRLDGLVNNAGINVGPDERKTIEAFSDIWWDRIISVDMTGTFNCSKAAIPLMNKGGSIVNISSVVGLVPMRNQCAFAAAKAGVANLTKAMALELAPKEIRVNCIAPGSVGMELTYKLWQDENAMKGLLAHIPMGRQAKADEIAGPVVFLCSDMASYMTGAIVPVDGGWIAGGYARNF